MYLFIYTYIHITFIYIYIYICIALCYSLSLSLSPSLDNNHDDDNVALTHSKANGAVKIGRVPTAAGPPPTKECMYHNSCIM